MRSTFWPNLILSLKALKSVTLAWNSRQHGKTVRFLWKLYKTLFSGDAQHVLAKSHFKPQSSQKRHTGLKFSPTRENSALSMKIVQNALFRSCAARFGQIAFLSVKVLKSSHWPEILAKTGKQCAFLENCTKRSFQVMRSTVWPNRILWASKFSKSSHWPEILFKTGKQCAFHENFTKRSFQVMRSTVWPNRTFERQSSQNRETGLKFSSKRENSALSIKIVRTLFSGHAQDVLAKSHFSAWKFLKSSHWPEILAKTGKQCAFYENCTKRSFQVMGSTFWPNRICERQSSQNRHTGLKFSPKRENSALSMKIVQNALFRSCAARFGQIAFLSLKALISSHSPESLAKTGEQCALHENCTKRFFQVMRRTFWPNRIFERESS